MRKKIVFYLSVILASFIFAACQNKPSDSTSVGTSEQEDTESTENTVAETTTSDTSTDSSSRPLTHAELAKCSYFANEKGVNGFLLSSYQTPLEADLLSVFYNGAGISLVPGKEQTEEYLSATSSTELTGDLIVMPVSSIDYFLTSKTGYTYEEYQKSGNDLKNEMVYLEKDQSYALTCGDSNYMTFKCVSGTMEADQTVVMNFEAEEDDYGNIPKATMRCSIKKTGGYFDTSTFVILSNIFTPIAAVGNDGNPEGSRHTDKENNADKNGNTDNNDNAEDNVTLLENPSWEYYCSSKSSTAPVEPLNLKKLTEEKNEIIDTEEWLSENGFSVPKITEIGSDADNDYIYELSGDDYAPYMLTVYSQTSNDVFSIDFSNYIYADEYIEADADFIRQGIRYVLQNEGILYVSIGHTTYAESAPHNAYVVAIDLATKKVLWKSQPLVSNCGNFVLIGDVIVCGYGFTAEPDYLYQLDCHTGKVIQETPLKSGPDYIFVEDQTLYVRTYNRNYTFSF